MISKYLPRFQERYSSKIPAMALLTQLGWSFIPPDEALRLRGGKASEVVLRDVLRDVLRKRRFVFEGEEHALSEDSLTKLVDIVCRPTLNEGLVKANERFYDHLLYGISVTEFINGKKANPTIALVDWDYPENNRFTFTEEFRVYNIAGTHYRQPDIVCFVNGIPWVVIEAKRPDSSAPTPTIEEGISQHLRNQRSDEIPQLFIFSQLLLSISGLEGKYATCGTPAKFWAVWCEEDSSNDEMTALKNQPIEDKKLLALFGNHQEDLTWFKGYIADSLVVNGQDNLLISLLTPTRLLELVRLFIVFDTNKGKIVARYQQFFAIKRLLDRVCHRRDGGIGRQGGVIWHTTGSGKSLTMVMLCKVLIFYPELQHCRILMVTDRVDLESQLSGTFKNSGVLSTKRDIANAVATSGKHLAEQISSGQERIIFALIQKFNTAIQQKECFNDSADMIVLVDEGHRSQGGENHILMKKALPNAAFIAFTGTPLLKDDKTTNKFGSIIHAYTMQRAVKDGTVTPLLYEERIPDLEINERAIDAWFERITAGLTEKEQADLKRKFTKRKQIYGAEGRIHLIAWDIASHLHHNVAQGLKGQLACDSKATAIKYQRYFDEFGLFESAVVISPPDTREGNISIDEATIPEVTRWWQEHVGSEGERAYTRKIIKRFADKNDPLRLLIVVDKLLTGFDEPRNAVLYIDKPLKGHNLIQAIARVNRLHEQKPYGLLLDYRGILKELDTTIHEYQDLATQTQAGYDIDDITGLYHQMSSEYKRLPQLYRDLWAIFNEVKNKQDIEQLRRVIGPNMVEQNGRLVDKHLKVREDFYVALRAFSACLNIALQSESFFADHSVSDDVRSHYKETVQQLRSLRQLVQSDSGERIDDSEYEVRINKLLDQHVAGVSVRESNELYAVNQMGEHGDVPESWSEDKTRNETDKIKTRLTRMIEHDLADDPYAKIAFSELLHQAINEAKELFDYPQKQYLLFNNLVQRVEARKLDDVPDVFQGNHYAQAYFGALLQTFPDADRDLVQKRWIELSFQIDQKVKEIIAEYSIDLNSILSNIHQSLLPDCFAESKALGGEMKQATTLLEYIKDIVCISLQKAQGKE